MPWHRASQAPAFSRRESKAGSPSRPALRGQGWSAPAALGVGTINGGCRIHGGDAVRASRWPVVHGGKSSTGFSSTTVTSSLVVVVVHGLRLPYPQRAVPDR